MIEARCLCGDHVWRVEPPLRMLHHCHCTFCRKHQGGAFATVGAVLPDEFEWIQRGEAIAYRSSPELVRTSCGRCGSPLPGDPPADGPFFVLAGPLEGDPGSPIDGHLFLADKAGWFEIEDGLPGFDAYPPGYDVAPRPTPESADPPGEGTRGSCLCGEVRFVASGPPLLARHCHCMRCRRARGALHASNYAVPVDGFRFTHGESAVRSFPLPGAKHFAQSFCERCGSAAPRVDEERGIVIIPMGSFDDDPPGRPDCHIFVASKADWFEIPGALPRYDEWPP